MKLFYKKIYLFVLLGTVFFGFSLSTQACTTPPLPSVSAATDTYCGGTCLNFSSNGGSTTAMQLQYDDNPSFTSPTLVTLGATDVKNCIAGTPGTTIYWRLRSIDCTGACSCLSAFATGTPVLIPACPITSDECAGAIALPFQSDASGNWTCSSTTGATSSLTANPPCWATNTSMEDIWYKVTISGPNLLVTTDQSNWPGIDSQIAIYSSCASATPIACSMDLSTEFSSLAMYPETTTGATTLVTGLISGATYYIRVDGDLGLDGFFCLKATGLPSNDKYANAVSLSLNNTITGSTYGTFEDSDGSATADCDLGGTTSIINCGASSGFSVENNIWYTYNCSATGTYRFKLENVNCNGDNGLQVWSAINNVSCSIFNSNTNDGGAGESCNSTAIISSTMINDFTCSAGETVRITVDGFAAEMCSFNVTLSSLVPINPVANDDSGTTNEDQPISFSITSNDTDMDGTIDANSVDLDPGNAGRQTSFTNSSGDFSIASTGILTYTPSQDYNGTTSISYTVLDNDLLVSNIANITINVTAINDNPVANIDTVTTDFNTAVTFSAIANDTDVDGTIDGSTADINPGLAGTQTTFTGTNGNWAVDASGMVTFTPNPGTTGYATASYTVKDNTGLVSNTSNLVVFILDCLSTSSADCDNDGLSNSVENGIGTNPSLADTDGDGLTDGEENTGIDQLGTTAVATGTSNPLDACSPFLPTVSISASGPLSFCPGGNVILSSSASNNNVWSAGGQTSNSITVTNAGTYTVTSQINGCTVSSNPVNIVVYSLPNVNAGSDISVCLGSSVTLSGSGAVSYIWDNGVSDGIPFSPSTSLNYTVTGIDANGCQNSDQVNVTVHSIPTIFTGGDVAICSGQSLTLLATGSGTITWNNGVVNGVSFVPVSTQTYLATITDINSCVATAQVTVTVNPNPIVDAGIDQVICNGSAVTLNGSGALSYTWDNGVSDGIAFNPSSSQNYQVTGTDANGCTGTDVVSVTVSTLSGINAGSDLMVCAGESVTLSGSGTGVSNFSWDNGVIDGVAFVPSGTFTYTLTANSVDGCIASDQVTVSVNPLPVVNAGADQTVCAGTSVTLNGSGAATYSWDNGISDGLSFVPVSTQTYTVNGTSTDGCTGTDIVTVTVNPLPTVSLLLMDSICNNAATFTLNQGTPAGGSYQVNGSNSIAFDPSTSPLGINTITYAFTDVNGCSGIASTNLFVDNCLSIDEKSAIRLKLYPNPSTGIFHLEGDELAQIEGIRIQDELGRIIQLPSQDWSTPIDLTQLSQGLYLIDIKTSAGSKNFKLLLTK